MGTQWEAVRKSLTALWRSTTGFCPPGGTGVPVFGAIPPTSEPLTDFVLVGADPVGEEDGGTFTRERVTVGQPARWREAGTIRVWVLVQAGDDASDTIRDAAILRADRLADAVDQHPWLDGTVAGLVGAEVQAGSVRVWHDEYGTAAEVQLTVAYIADTGV